jgi:DNA repair protein REV1
MDKFLCQLSDEVSSRLVKLGNLKGRSITLKIMVRSQNAPEETAKFLGHGLCDSFSKGCTLSLATNESSMIKREVLSLMRLLKTDPKDLRGIGIQVSKLEKTLDHKAAGQTPSILTFWTKSPLKARSSPIPSGSKKEVSSLDIDDIDVDVLKELPEDIRKEIEAEMMKQKKAEKSSAVNKPEENVNDDLRQDEMSFSQLDASVLAQLPDDLVQELREQHGKSHRKQVKPAVTTAFDCLMSTKGQAASPQVKKRGGKTLKNSPRFVKKSNKTSPPPQKPEVKRVLDFELQVQDVRDIQDVQDVEDVPDAALDDVGLNGMKAIEDIRPMLRNWVKSCQEPTEDDLETVIHFFTKAIMAQNEEIVYLALKSLCKQCQLVNNPTWSSAYNKIIFEIQETFKKCTNGKQLYVNFVF